MDKKILVFLGLLALGGLSFAHFGQEDGDQGIPSDVAQAMATVMNYMHGTNYTVEDFEGVWSYGGMMGMMHSMMHGGHGMMGYAGMHGMMHGTSGGFGCH